MTDRPTDTRSILNAVAALRAGQEQMQSDVDRLRAATHALLVFALYGIVVVALTFFAIRKETP